MARVLVTGAGGYIGRTVTRKLVEYGLNVVSVDRVVADLHPSVEQIIVDFAELDSHAISNLGQVDVLLHLAWADGFNHNSPAHIDNLPAHVRLVRSALEAGVSQIAALGTMHEVGYWEGRISEDTPCSPMSLYGIAKFALREAMRLEAQKAGGIFQWLRAYYIVGDDIRNNSLFRRILEWEAEGKETFPFTCGVNKYDFIDVHVLGDQIARCIAQKDVQGIIECCSGNPLALRDKVERFLQDKALRIRPEFGAFPDRPYDSPGVWGDASKIHVVMDNARLISLQN